MQIYTLHFIEGATCETRIQSTDIRDNSNPTGDDEPSDS